MNKQVPVPWLANKDIERVKGGQEHCSADNFKPCSSACVVADQLIFKANKKGREQENKTISLDIFLNALVWFSLLSSSSWATNWLLENSTTRETKIRNFSGDARKREKKKNEETKKERGDGEMGKQKKTATKTKTKKREREREKGKTTKMR